MLQFFPTEAANQPVAADGFKFGGDGTAILRRIIASWMEGTTFHGFQSTWRAARYAAKLISAEL